MTTQITRTFLRSEQPTLLPLSQSGSERIESNPEIDLRDFIKEVIAQSRKERADQMLPLKELADDVLAQSAGIEKENFLPWLEGQGNFLPEIYQMANLATYLGRNLAQFVDLTTRARLAKAATESSNTAIETTSPLSTSFFSSPQGEGSERKAEHIDPHSSSEKITLPPSRSQEISRQPVFQLAEVISALIPLSKTPEFPALVEAMVDASLCAGYDFRGVLNSEEYSPLASAIALLDEVDQVAPSIREFLEILIESHSLR